MTPKDELEVALVIATQAHRGIYDKTNRPSILHPLRVMMMLNFNHGDGYTCMTIAVLHDVVEDTKITLEKLREEGFSDAIVDAVDAITHRKGKETYMEYIKRCCANPLARIVKKADLSDNMHRNDGLPEKEKESLMKRYKKAMDYIYTFEN